MNDTHQKVDPFGVRDTLETESGSVGIYRLDRLERLNLGRIDRLPYSIRVLLEAVLRTCDGYQVTEQNVREMAAWQADAVAPVEVPFKPARVILQDFTGVPAVVDLAAMRGAMHRLGGDPKKINPLIPVDLVVDHSIQVDRFGSDDALQTNVELEFKRNRERYEFLRWGQHAFQNFRAVPPNVGIVHQVNLEYLAKAVFLGRDSLGPVAYPDTLVGTDSHTTMVNGMGVLGWGVGGIEAEAVMLGQPLYMLMPEVVGMELTGQLPPAATATDLVLTLTELLRRAGVVGKFVEYFGPGVSSMTVADRATLGNMAPEYGATAGFFAVDEQTLIYLRQTGRSAAEVDLVERYTKTQGLFRTEQSPRPNYSQTLHLDLSTVEPCVAGPKRPQDRILLGQAKSAFQAALRAPVKQRGFALSDEDLARTAPVVVNGETTETIGHGAVIIAAITSCTNTSNPSVMLAAGLLAEKAAARGLRVKPHVKTSLAPGSRVVQDYLEKSGLMSSLKQLGFHIVGFGCTTCIGNSGPIPEPVAQAVTQGDLVAAAILSGNRNFEGRINPLVKANYLASPPLAVAFALAGTIDIDLMTEPLGRDRDGQDVFLREIWPTPVEIRDVMDRAIDPAMFRTRYGDAFEGNEMWNRIPVHEADLYAWDSASTYIQEPPFLDGLTTDVSPIRPIRDARVLAALGDSVTTDHISPAGSISKDSPAGRFLIEHGVQPADFNSYGSRRGNDRVMIRGTFANIRIRNQLADGKEGGWTRHLTDGELMSIYDAAMKYRDEGTPLVILAGAEYGTGSSRDWAAKGTFLLGVRAVIAASFERIHRSNLVGMGVLPLEFMPGQTWQSLGLTGLEQYTIEGLDDQLEPRSNVTVTAVAPDGSRRTFEAHVRIDTPVELDYYRNGGILQTVLRKLLAE